MNSLDQVRNARSAARQIRSQARAGVLTPGELYRLLDAVEAGFDQVMGQDAAPADLPPFHVINGGRR
ncbi:MAG: hypothetical protein ACK41C_10300 [Phenylobacterium sp.]|uniref:hypothetical protein n=1 Tax=Phenylobacterium sp. TaxID=1871053 RepID=UPI003919C753